ncbi:hypothetical protein BJX65DRAFT_223051 [Aspergillus insuetus]
MALNAITKGRMLETGGHTEDLRYRAQIWWNGLKLRLLPEGHHSRGRSWIEWHMSRLERCYAILQRERQLSQEGGDQIYIYNLHPRESLNTKYASKSALSNEERDQELRLLRAEFRKLQKEMTTSDRPDNALTWMYRMYWRLPYDKDGRHALWYLQRQECSDRGGCCARECGCCEKLLHEYVLHKYGLDKEHTKRPRKVYGHCTSECACCVITHEFYEPHEHLPTPMFVAQGGASGQRLALEPAILEESEGV